MSKTPKSGQSTLNRNSQNINIMKVQRVSEIYEQFSLFPARDFELFMSHSMSIGTIILMLKFLPILKIPFRPVALLSSKYLSLLK